MDGRGQMLLLSALVVCLGLIVLTVCLTSIREVEAVEGPMPGGDVLDNVAWALHNGMKHTAGKVGGSPWEQRQNLTGDFKSRIYPLIDDTAHHMQKRGIAFSLRYNDSLAIGYLGGDRTEDTDHAGGVLIKREGVTARVCGCACDLTLSDGSAEYSASKVIVWA